MTWPAALRFGAAALALLVVTACAGPAPLQVSQSGAGAYEPALAAMGGGVAVAWYDNRDGNAEIYVRLVGVEPEAGAAASGRDGLSPEVRLTRSGAESYEASVDGLGERRLAVAWYEKSATGELEARLGLWTAERGFLWETPVEAREGSSRNPVVVADRERGRVFCAWIGRGDGRESVMAAWWGEDGEVLGEPLRLGLAGTTTWNLNATPARGGAAVVVWDAATGRGTEELHLARVDAAGVRRVRLTREDGHASKYPDIALGRDRAALTWFDEKDGNREVYLWTGSAERLWRDGEAGAGIDGDSRRVTESPGETIGAYVAYSAAGSGSFGLAWSDEVDGGRQIFFLALDAGGSPLAEPRRLSSGAGLKFVPAIEALGEGFALTWNEVRPGPGGLHGGDSRSEVFFAEAGHNGRPSGITSRP